MIGGINGIPVFPVNLEESQFQCDSNALTQLQLFGNFPAGIDVNPGNYAGHDHIPALSRPGKRSREVEDSSRQQNLQIPFHNYCQERAGQLTTFLNPNDVSTGLRLSYDDDEHNSSVTSASGSMPSLNIMVSLSDNVKNEIDRQKEELENYITIQEQGIAMGVRELKERHTASFLSAIEEDVGSKLREKDLQIENMNEKNKELVEKIKQAASEAQSWHCRARYRESVVRVLKTNLKQAAARGGGGGGGGGGAAAAKEGYGDSEVDDDDAASSYRPNNNNMLLGSSSTPQASSKGVGRRSGRVACKSCKNEEVSVLLLPCRHLCLCRDCEALVHLCPVCRCVKTTSVQVYVS